VLSRRFSCEPLVIRDETLPTQDHEDTFEASGSSQGLAGLRDNWETSALRQVEQFLP